MNWGALATVLGNIGVGGATGFLQGRQRRDERRDRLRELLAQTGVPLPDRVDTMTQPGGEASVSYRGRTESPPDEYGQVQTEYGARQTATAEQPGITTGGRKPGVEDMLNTLGLTVQRRQAREDELNDEFKESQINRNNAQAEEQRRPLSVFEQIQKMITPTQLAAGLVGNQGRLPRRVVGGTLNDPSFEDTADPDALGRWLETAKTWQQEQEDEKWNARQDRLSEDRERRQNARDDRVDDRAEQRKWDKELGAMSTRFRKATTRSTTSTSKSDNAMVTTARNLKLFKDAYEAKEGTEFVAGRRYTIEQYLAQYGHRIPKQYHDMLRQDYPGK